MRSKTERVKEMLNENVSSLSDSRWRLCNSSNNAVSRVTPVNTAGCPTFCDIIIVKSNFISVFCFVMYLIHQACMANIVNMEENNYAKQHITSNTTHLFIN